MSTQLSSVFEERRFTRDELNRMIEAGLFANDERRLELIHGRLVVVPPEGPLHASSSTDLRDRMIAAYAGRAHVREAKPLDCGREEQPEPDLAAVRGAARDYDGQHPRGNETVLVVEMSRTTQMRDREKVGIYAGANVPVYWLVDLAKRRVELYSEPTGDRYALVHLVGEDDELELPGAGVRLRVGELFG